MIAMIRMIRLTALGALVLALGLGPIGCAGETGGKDTAKDRKAAEEHKKEKEGYMKRMMEAKDKSGGEATDEKDKAKEDQKIGDKDKEKKDQDK
jgi:hypothetical protein